MLMRLCVGLLAVATAVGQPNIVLIVADDMGVDLVNRYYEAAARPCTPNIDALSRRGLLFRNAWANPSCSPTRAQILTGLHARRSGVGRNVSERAASGGLQLELDLLPRLLNELGYDTSLVGKWHLADMSQGLLHPNEAGFGFFAGSMSNLAGSDFTPDAYSNWEKNTQGVLETTSRYATRDTARDAIDRMQQMEPPWFLQVNFNAPHTPIHRPPLVLCPPQPACDVQYCYETGNAALLRSMVEAMDNRIGVIMEEIDATAPDTLVIFMGDNGSVGDWTFDPFDPNRAKNTMYEGGLNVPLIVAGPGVVQNDETDALVSAVDLLATLVDLAGGRLPALDSVSFLPVLANPTARVRDAVLAESFNFNFHPAEPFPEQRIYERAVRNDRYKLIRTLDNGEVTLELYDLRLDRFERENLYPPQLERLWEPFEHLATQLVREDAAPGADVNSDGVVDLSDLARVLAGIQTEAPGLFDGDTNLDGVVDGSDLMNVLTHFGIRS